MKKILLLAAVVVAAMASCQSKASKTAQAEADSLALAETPVTDVTDVYEGTIPAADGPGIDYLLTLNAAVEGNDTVYSLDLTYLDAEGKGKNKTVSSKGKQQTISKVVNNAPKKAIKLVPADGKNPVYFVVVNDTTLRLVNDSLLQETVSDLNYDIVKVKK